MYDTLRARGIKRIKKFQKDWKVEWFDSLEMWLTVIGNGIKPKYDPYAFFVGSITLGIFIFVYTLKITGSFLLGPACGLVAGVLPIMFVYLRFLNITSKVRKGFLSFVDAYTQTYLDYGRVVTLAFKEVGKRCPEEMQSFIAYINLCIADSTVPFEKSIQKFAEILNFGWAHDFVSIVISGKNGEYKNIEGALNNLSISLWAAKGVDLERKGTIRVVFLLMIFLTVVAVILMKVNMELLPEAKQIYFATPEGINFLTISVLILVVSFVGALIWSKRGDRL